MAIVLGIPADAGVDAAGRGEWRTSDDEWQAACGSGLVLLISCSTSKSTKFSPAVLRSPEPVPTGVLRAQDLATRPSGRDAERCTLAVGTARESRPDAGATMCAKNLQLEVK